jgi:hypothetical protein
MFSFSRCKSEIVVYGLECNLCGLVYVGETKGKLHKRIEWVKSVRSLIQIRIKKTQWVYEHSLYINL